jgi:hypothetical protein
MCQKPSDYSSSPISLSSLGFGPASDTKTNTEVTGARQAPMGQYDSKLLGSEEVARSTIAFHSKSRTGSRSRRVNRLTFFCRSIFQA